MNGPEIAVIGAGVAGLGCALALSRAQAAVTVYEADGVPGGRLGGRVVDGCHFDVGAQYFTARSAAFGRQVEAWRAQWLVEPWQAWLVDLEQGRALSREDGVTRYVGRPRMAAVVEDMAALCRVRYGTAVARLAARPGGGWRLLAEDGGLLGEADRVLCATPAPEAARLLEVRPALAAAAAAAVCAPCWAVLLGFEDPPPLGFDGAFVVDPVVTWMARENSKPERDTGGLDAWVVHAGPEWSEAQAGSEAGSVVEAVLAAAARACGRALPVPALAEALFLPAARVVSPLGEPCLFDAEAGLGACGDWCLGARVEDAFLSGLALAARVIADAG
ncbi:MAG: hypothetical protein KatS3mg121_0907 [Gammaproteobacteria bacterium]|nr:MAG: hypothetical protein KatS3mg121_0907 [Gammaproteobacteria bacterium]